MSKGTGSLQTFQKSKAGGAPPATVTGAADGLLLDGTTVKLGQPFGFVPGDPAQLLEDRRIPLFGFRFLLDGNVIGADFNDTATQQISLFDALTGNPSLLLDFAGSNVYLGDANNFIDPVLYFKGNAAGGPFAQLYQQDIPGATWFDLSMQGAVNPDFALTMQGAVRGKFHVTENSLDYSSALTSFFNLDPTSDAYRIGRPVTGPQLSIDPNHFRFTAQSRDFLLADLTNQVYSFGDNVAGPFFQMQTTAGNNQAVILLPVGANPTSTVLDLHPAGRTYRIGDVNANDQGLSMTLDDNLGIANFGNIASNAKLSVNSIPGITTVKLAPINSITITGGIITAIT